MVKIGLFGVSSMYTIFLFFPMALFSQSQSSFLDSVTADNNLKIRIVFHLEKRNKAEYVTVFRKSSGELFAKIQNDTLKKTIKITQDKMDRIRNFEDALSDSTIKTNVVEYFSFGFIEGCLAEYEIVFKTQKVNFTSKTEYYSLIKELFFKTYIPE